MTFGVFSRLFALTGPAKIKKRVAGEYRIGLTVLESLLHHLVYLRNLCAHHSRLWNRKFTITLQLPMSYPPALVAALNPSEDRRLYNSLVLLAYFVGIIEPLSPWSRQLCGLINSRQEHFLRQMGVPSDWQRRPMWAAILKKENEKSDANGADKDILISDALPPSSRTP
jgi:abortive infection bacteriophage resistance protein